MAFSWFPRRSDVDPADDVREELSAEFAAGIVLRVEDGLLMAFGPDDDPVPPSLVASACAEDPKGTLQLETGETVDRRCVLNVLDAQQKGKLADQPSDGWIEAMLCLGGAFEPTTPELLAEEPIGEMPSLPDQIDGEDPDTEVLTPIAFDESERKALAKADALLIDGLDKSLTLSAGRYDQALDGWLLRPSELSSLAIRRQEKETSRATRVDVTAVAFEGKGRRWPIANKSIELA